MLESLKRIFSPSQPDHDLADMAAWAQRRGHRFKRERSHVGFVIDGVLEDKPWRIEWGPSQRPYITGHELRLRMELALPSDLQMLLISRPLMDSLERQTFEDFTDTVQTTIGTKAPEEMRWLVMFPKVDMAALKALKSRFGLVASVPEHGLSWTEGPLAHMVEQASKGFLREDPPFVLMTLRGRTYLRMQLAEPEVADVAGALAIFETAVTQALRVASDMGERKSGRSGAEKPAADSQAGEDATAWQSFDSTQPPGKSR